MKLSLLSYIQGVKDGTLNPYDVVHHYFHKAQESDLNTFVHFHEQYIQAHLEEFSHKDLCSAPIAIKDIILTKGYLTTSCSGMLTEYRAPYSASCFEKLEQSGALMIGKTNMDDAAMGTTNESSVYGPVKNPFDPKRVSGGSSGGSAAAVAADECLAALGTDTGGSIRLPAAWCGIVGMKPTYGRVSRYGVSAMSSSLDQVGVLTKNIDDAELLLRTISGYDPKDMTSEDRHDMHERSSYLGKSVQGLKIGVPKQYFGTGLDPKIANRIREVIFSLQQAGAEIIDLDIPLLDYGVMTYYIICPAEVSSNMSRLEGMRFGYQKDTKDFGNIYDYFSQVRTEGLGKEVKRRILIGGYVLGSGHIDHYYNKARSVQTMLRQSLDSIYEQVDVILGPTTPTVAPYVGQFTDDPVQLYLMDVYTVIANLCGYPAVSLPVGLVEDQGVLMPVGCQLMSKKWNEKVLFQVGKYIEGIAF